MASRGHKQGDGSSACLCFVYTAIVRHIQQFAISLSRIMPFMYIFIVIVVFLL